MNKVLRVLIVDDSLVFRETLFKELGKFLPEGSILERADNPFSARDKILEFKPDVMLLDVEMPKLDGIEFLKRLLAQYPLPTVVMSADDEYCSEALSAGACDFVAKPGSGKKFDDKYLSDIALRLKTASLRRIHTRPYEWYGDKGRQSDEKPVSKPAEARKRTVNPKSAAEGTAMYLPGGEAIDESSYKVIKRGVGVSPGRGFMDSPSCNRKRAQDKEDHPVSEIQNDSSFESNSDMNTASASEEDTGSKTESGKISLKTKKITLIAIGASTGGTMALTKVITALRPPLPPIVIVQHIPANFSRLFAERLNDECVLEIKEAKDGDRLEANHVYIAPGGLHMRLVSTITGTKIECAPGKPVNSVCPAVDVLFYTVADLYGKEALGVILTGMGKDGADGLLRMRKAGATTLGQDERTCVVYGMPKAAWDIGAVQRQMPLDSIAGTIMAIAAGNK